MRCIRMLCADGPSVVLEGLSLILNQQLDTTVATSAATADEALPRMPARAGSARSGSRTMCNLRKALLCTSVLLLPHAAYAQASLTGVARDSSGAVLPGVTVEAASPALIEKTRTAVTDGTGQYRIEILPPGTYTLTFTLSGFNTFKREGVQLSGTFTASVDGELRVGALEETVTVSGESPLVDVQSAARQRIVDRELIDALPGARSPMTIAGLIPGVNIQTQGQDLGGSAMGLTGNINLGLHGNRGQAQLLLEGGMPTNAWNVPSSSRYTFNMGSAQEVTYQISSSTAEYNAGGVTMNVIPREGGNRFNGTLFMNGANRSLQGSNFPQEVLLENPTLTPDLVLKQLDVNPGFGGPLKRDRLWFYGSLRYAVTSRTAGGEYQDKNFNNPNVWIYEPDLTKPMSIDTTVKDARVRLTWQAAPRIKIGGLWVEQTATDFPNGIGRVGGSVVGGNPGVRVMAYESTNRSTFPIERQRTFDLTAPWTNRLLFDGAVMDKVQVSSGTRVPGLDPGMLQVVDQATNRTYRGRNGANGRQGTYKYSYRGAVSYITGAHSFKVGLADQFGHYATWDDEMEQNPVSYRFNNGIPNQLTMRAPIAYSQTNFDHTFGAFVQDRWTIDRLTLNVGLRYDSFQNSFPEQIAEPSVLAPTRNIVLPAISNISWHDLNPKFGLAYDLFGDGKTALKTSLNRYVQAYVINGIAGAPNPTNTLVTSTTRNWNDANRNFIPDCDLRNLAANLECGAAASRDFGGTRPAASFDPDILRGWGKRDYNWEFTASVERQLRRNLSADFSYYRRWFGNLLVTDNLAVAPSDYTQFDYRVPVDARLPGGGGYVVHGIYDLIPSKVGATDNYTTFSKNYGNQVQLYNAVALTMSARLPGRLTVQGGFDTGKQVNDDCELTAKIPELNFGALPLLPGLNPGVWAPEEFCRMETRWNTQVKLLGSYTVPRIDLQTSATLTSSPGGIVLANYAVPAVDVRAIIGRDPTAGANVPVELVVPGSLLNPRISQVDMRFAKILRFGRMKVTASADLYNLLNVNTLLLVNNVYTATSWQQPQSLMMARLAKFGMQIDF